MPIGRVLTSCFGGGVSPSVSGDGPGTTASSTASANAPAAGGAVEFLHGVESRHHPSHVKTRTLPLVARGSEDPSDARDSGCSTAESPVAQIQRILAACSTTPSGPGPLSTLSRSALNAFCQSLDVPLALVVFEDAADTELQAQHSSGLTVEAARSGGAFTSFEMQAHPWHFMFKVRCVWVNGATVQALGAGPMDAAIQHISTTANKNTAMRCDLMGLLKGIEHGQSQAVKTWNTYYQNKDMDLAALWLQPCLWSTADGSRFIACLIHTEPQPSQATLLKAMAQDHMCLESIPYSVTTVTEQGMICSQNAAARASFGAFLSVLHGGQGVNFLEELFYGHPDLRAKMHRQLQCASSFQVCIQLLSPLLRDWLNLEDGDEVWHQLYITRVAGAGPQDPAYVIVQPDITDMVITERKVAQLQQQHQGLLKEILPPEVMEAILHSKMMQDAAPAARGRDAQDLGMYLEESERECEDADSATMPTSRSSHQLMQLTSSGAQHPAMLRSAPRGRRPSQLVVNETQSTLNATLMASQEALANHGVPSASISQLSGDKKGIWLTQQDVQNLATNHESVTILFADIKGFTALSQTLHPAEVMLFLNQLYSIWDAMLDSYGVYKVETIGDSYMVAGGLFSIDPESKLPKLGGYDPRHAQKVLDFGRAMLESAALVVDPRGDPVQIRIGIHSGACVSGVVGQRMPRFCLFGDTINTASRMESTCPRPGCIHASGASQALLNHEPWVPTGGVFCKGKGIMQSFYLHVSAENMTAEELAEEQKLLLPASLLIAGASEAPSEQAMADDLSRAHSSLQHSSLQHNTGPGAHLAASSSSHLGGSSSHLAGTGSSLLDAQVASLASYAQLPGLEQQADKDEMWDARSRDDHSADLVPTCSGLERSLIGSASFLSARNTPLGAPSCSGVSDMSSPGSRGGLASKPLTRLASSHSGQLPVACSSCAEDSSDALPQGVRVRAHIKAHGEHPAGSGSGALSTFSRADLSQTSHATAVSTEPQVPLPALLGPLEEPMTIAASASQPQHTLQSSSLTTATAPNTWPVMNAQMGVAGYDLSQDLLAGHSVVAGGNMNRHDCVPQSMSCTFRRNSPTSPPKVPLPSVAEGPPPPITPAATPAGRKDNNNWKVTSYDGRARGPGQGAGLRPNLGRLSTVAEQAQRVLQELHQSRPRPRELSKPMNVHNFDRRGSIDVYRRGSMDVRRVGSDVPHRGSLDLAWATVEKFRRSQSPRPTVVHEYPEQSSGSFVI